MALPWAVLPTMSAGSEFTGTGHSGLARLVWFQVFQRLKAAHSALEEEYLKACREQHLAQQLAGSKGTPGKFDPGRYCRGGRPGRRNGAGPFPRSPGEAHFIIIIDTLRGTGRSPIQISHIYQWVNIEG